MRKCFLLLALGMLIGACQTEEKDLPIYGMRQLDEAGDTVFHTIGEFSFVNQDSQIVTQKYFEGHVYVADFFFTNCPTICPNMTAQMSRVYDKFKGNSKVLLLSHSIDTVNDSVSVLKDYAEKLGVETEKWHFITGNRDDIYKIAKDKYYISAMEDEKAEGGYLHNQKFVLVDTKGRIRGYYTGTESAEVDRMMADMAVLLEKN